MLADLFRHKVLRMLLSKGKVTAALVENLLSWPHSGFHVHQGERIEADDKAGGEQMVRYYGWYSNKSRGIRRKATQEGAQGTQVLPPDPSAKQYRRHWAQLIQKVYEVDPLVCPKCQGEMRIISFIDVICP